MSASPAARRRAAAVAAALLVLGAAAGCGEQPSSAASGGGTSYDEADLLDGLREAAEEQGTVRGTVEADGAMIEGAAVVGVEPPEADVMHRPPRRSDEPILSGFLVWRITFVSVLFVVAVFAMFEWAIRRGLPLEEARTIVVNTLVVLEIFYLFSVRFLHAPSLTWRGILGTRPVLIGVGAVVLAQLAFTYLPPMQALFHTRAVSLLDGVAIVAAGVILLLILEGEKRLWGHAGRLNPAFKHRRSER